MDVLNPKALWWLLCLLPLAVVLKLSLVDRPRLLKRLATGLRLLAIVLLILALCLPFLSLRADGIHVAFLLDVSESVDLSHARAAVREIETCMRALSPLDSWSLLFVADGVRSVTNPQEAADQLERWQEQAPDQAFRSASKLSDALLAARLCFPANKARRIVLFTDCRSTQDHCATALTTLAQEEIDVQLHRLAGVRAPEACITSLKPNSPKAFKGEMVRMTAQVRANQSMPATLRLVHSGVVAGQKHIILDPNQDNPVSIEVPVLTSGATHWRAELETERDHFHKNNQTTCTVTVSGEPRLLVLHQNPRKLRALEKSLREQQFGVDLRGKHGVPEDLAELLAFDAVLLADVAATDMSPQQMALLKRYVVDFGGGLAMFGSNNSFGLGGYHNTPVEEVLPLISRFEKQEEQPSVAMALVIDKSGSMQGQPIELARQAAKTTVELLGSQDYIGIVAFDGQPFTVCPMTRATEAALVKQAIDTLASGGGTFMYPGLENAFAMLREVSAKIKHVIVLSDGRSKPDDHEGLVADMANAGITVSTIALGDADRDLLAALAEIGKGRYYETNDPTQIPQIFTKDTMETSRTAVKEDLFNQVQVADHPLLAGFDGVALPVVFGHVMTHVKPATQLLLVTHAGDPLMAVSRYGLGSTLAYTSDLTDKWGSQWLAWNHFGRFWSQALRSILRRQSTEGLSFQQTQERDAWTIDINRFDEKGQPVSGVQFNAQTLDVTGKSESVPVEEVGLGRYRIKLPIDREESLTLRLDDPAHHKSATLHYNRPYPEEYRLSETGDPALETLPLLDRDAIREGITPATTRQSISHICYLLALIAMLTGLLFRRI